MSEKAYVFVCECTTWTQKQKLVPSDVTANDQFGRSVALNGNVAVISSLYSNTGGAFDGQRGSAYVFVRSNTTWTQQQKLVKKDEDVCIDEGDY